MTTALDPHVPIAITERAHTYTQVAVDLDWAHLRARWGPRDTCDTCGAHGDQPCRTRGGNDARQWHRGRG